jgi:superfamily I DNA/RNA helicase
MSGRCWSLRGWGRGSRAALEMTRRAQRIVVAAMEERAGGKGSAAPAVRLPWSGTFHSVANRLIRRNAGRVGLEESFSVLDRGDAADLMDVVRHELGFSKAERRFPRKDTCLAIYSHKAPEPESKSGTGSKTRKKRNSEPVPNCPSKRDKSTGGLWRR